MTSPNPAPPRIESLRVENYRALRQVTFHKVTPLTVLLGPNGSGKSTVFDVFAFLSEAFGEGLRRAWDRRGRFKELRSRDSDGPILVEIKYREGASTPLITYHLEIDERGGAPVVSREFLRWKRVHPAAPFHFLDYSEGDGIVVSGEAPEPNDERVRRPLSGPDVLAVGTLGQLAENPRVIGLRNFIAGWHLSYLSADAVRGKPEAGAEAHLSSTGDNLANVIQFLEEQHRDHLQEMLGTLRRRVPCLEAVSAEALADGSLLLRVKDAPFTTPVLSRFASDGTLKLLAYLALLNDPEPPQLIGIEEPENFLHPRLLPELAEECNLASDHTQLILTTHSPFLLHGLNARQVWVLQRAEDGYTRAVCAAEVPGIQQFVAAGAELGDLWMQGYLEDGTNA